VFDLDDPDQKAFDKLPEWIRQSTRRKKKLNCEDMTPEPRKMGQKDH
jgi:hypothetical protein